MFAGQRSGGVEGVQYWQSGGADFLPTPLALPQVCYLVAIVVVVLEMISLFSMRILVV